MNLLDVLLLLAVAVFAASGYQRGLVAGLVSLAGFVGGAAAGVWLLPFVVDHLTPGTLASSVVAMLVVLVPAAAGQNMATEVAWRLRRSLDFHWKPVRWVDGLGGALLNTVAVLLVAWIAASALVPSPAPGLNSAIQGSRVLEAVQDRMPDEAPTWFSRANKALTDAGFPQVFNPFEDGPTAEVPAPSGDSVTASVVAAAQQSTVKITAAAGFEVHEGSGFVFADGRVMTNAHVVDGASAVTVQIGGVGQQYPATITRNDPDIDVAVLSVPGLQAPALSLADDAERGAPAVVAGYPGGSGLDLRAATVAQRLHARGQDIHGGSVVTRDIYAVRALVRPGNSGGPLLTPDGQVYGVVFARSVSDADTGYVLTADQVRGYLS